MEIIRQANGKVKFGNKDNLVGSAAIAQENMLKPELVITFLTSIGAERAQPNASENANKLVNSYSPSVLSYKYCGFVDFYTRGELNLLYFNYLVRYCAVEPTHALQMNQDERFWSRAFPESKGDTTYIKEYESSLAPLFGKQELIEEARAARRYQIFDLLILKQRLSEDEPFQDFVTKEGIKLVDSSGKTIFRNYDIPGLVITYIGKLIERNRAEDWLLAKPIFDSNWVIETLQHLKELYLNPKKFSEWASH